MGYVLKVKDIEIITDFLNDLNNVQEHLLAAWDGSEREGDLNQGDAAKVVSCLTSIYEISEIANDLMQLLDDANALDLPVEVTYW